MLRPGGTLALFWNHPFLGREGDAVHAAIRKVYHRFGDNMPERPETDTARYAEISDTIKRRGFADVETLFFHSERHFTVEEYIGLLNTYSDHRRIFHAERRALEDGIREAIDENGGLLTVYDTIDLYLARKLFIDHAGNSNHGIKRTDTVVSVLIGFYQSRTQPLKS